MTPTATKRLREATLVTLLLTAGCGSVPSENAGTEGSRAALAGGASALQDDQSPGSLLFRQETFGGNGRTCETCHGMATGTVSPAELQARHQQNPNDPIFRPLDSDDGKTGSNYSRLLTDATILVSIPLPPNVKLLNDLKATHVVVQRGIPSTLDSPALDPVLMLDGRKPTLESQALGAIVDHTERTREPTAEELAQIASFEKTLFSSQAMADYARTGVAPALPEGNTESEKRGRAFFQPNGICGQCHTGPLLAETGPSNIIGQPPGERFSTAFVSEYNLALRPTHAFLITREDGMLEVRTSPDPGRFLITGKVKDFNHFKMVSLWNIKNTAPYFHDNSAKTLKDVMDQYTVGLAPQGIVITPQDTEDIIAWMNLL